MSRRAALPLNREAVRKSDDQFYAEHPELIQNGRRIPLDPVDPKQADLRSRWMDLYEANNRAVGPKSVSSKKPEDSSQSCPLCKKDEGQLVITVIDQDGKGVPDATVTADGLTKQTDQQGVADFGIVPAKTYQISANKDQYYPWGEPGSPAQAFDDCVEVPSQQKATAKLGLQPCVLYQLKGKPILIAKGAESLTPPIQTIPIPGSVGGTLNLDFGQDTTYAMHGKVLNPALIEDEEHLKAKMYKLLDVFARDDTDGKAKRELDAFLSKHSTITMYTDPKLDKAIEIDENFVTYPDRTLAAPGSKFSNPPKMRIHQALEAAGWDVNKIAPITDLGVPAFNAGDKFPFKETGDWANGLAVMIDSVQYVFVFVDQYEYNYCRQQYSIRLIFELYDVFGLDDEDVKAYGEDGFWDTIPQQAITAWWKLQHTYDYAPLITKAVVTKTFTVPTN
jgi:hypothetical protein